MIALGLDPGLANCGWAWCSISRGDEGAIMIRPAEVGVFESRKSTARLNVLAADDTIRRVRELARWLGDAIGAQRPGVICAEAMSHPRHASSAAKLAMAWGAIAALAERRGIPVVMTAPQAIKLAVTGRRTASKVDVQDALLTRFGEPEGWPRTVALREHAADALGAVVACARADVVLAALGASA